MPSEARDYLYENHLAIQQGIMALWIAPLKIIAFNGSPREGGNTEELLRAAIRGTGHDDVRVFRLQSMEIAPCLNCGGC
ncbi:hypothetical protein LCGC14_3047590, partial [marine sediment metagenome]